MASGASARNLAEWPDATPGDADMMTSADAPLALCVMLVVPTLEAGAADRGALDIARILTRAGHRVLVISQGGRLEALVAATGAEVIRLRVASKNPLMMLTCARRLGALVRAHRCDVVHALGRTSAWSAFAAARLTRTAFVTSWYKGFREQNVLKHMYNKIMVRGDRVVASSDQLADLICDRYGTPWSRIVVVPTGINAAEFDPATISPQRIERMRQTWGVPRGCRIILAPGRMIRRKGHHLLVQAAQRLKAAGIKDFACVFIGEDQGRTTYTGELWDAITATGTEDVVRIAGNADDLAAAYAAAAVVVSASVQAEGVQRSLLEAQAAGVPVVASDLGAGPDVVLAPPAIAEERMTGLRFPAGDGVALAAALTRILGLPDSSRRAIGARGRDWVLAHYDEATIADQMLRLYLDTTRIRR